MVASQWLKSQSANTQICELENRLNAVLVAATAYFFNKKSACFTWIKQAVTSSLVSKIKNQ
jgi:hypothetical protein